MSFYFIVSLLVLFDQTIGMKSSDSLFNENNVILCLNNKPTTIQIFTQSSKFRGNCQCQVNLSNEPTTREDYVHTSGIGFHKLHTTAKTWNNARKVCRDEGADLAIINSNEEEAVLVKMLNSAKTTIKEALNKEEALIGIHDMFEEGDWVTVFGDSIYSTGYANWSSTYFSSKGQPDNYQGNQNCGAVLDQRGMDDVSCQDKFAFFCELPISC